MIRNLKLNETFGLIALSAVSIVTLLPPAQAGQLDGPESVQEAMDRIYRENRKAASSTRAQEAEQEFMGLFHRRAERLENKKKDFFSELTKYTFHPDGNVTLRDPAEPDIALEPGVVEEESQPADSIGNDGDGDSGSPLPYAGPLSPEYQAGQAGLVEPVIRSTEGPKEIVFPGKKAPPSSSPR